MLNDVRLVIPAHYPLVIRNIKRTESIYNPKHYEPDCNALQYQQDIAVMRSNSGYHNFTFSIKFGNQKKQHSFLKLHFPDKIILARLTYWD